MGALPEFRLESFFARWEFAATYHLCASDIESRPMQALVDGASEDLRRAWSELRLGYTETRGGPALREAIANTYDACDADDVLAFTGAEEGLYVAMHALLGPGDHAVVVTPNYQSAESVPLSLCEVSGIALDANDGWSLDLDALEGLLRPETRLVSINFPHNPTGKVLPQADFASLVDLLRERGIWLFSDEVYRGVEQDPERRLPHAADAYERGLSLNVMSKAYGLPGLRVGWIACRDRALLDRMEKLKHYLSICNAGPAELLATMALEQGNRILAENRTLLAGNLAILEDFLAEHAALFDWWRPDGGCVAFPRYRGAEGVEAFCAGLVESHGVLLLPASVYRSQLTATPGDRFRIGYGRADLSAALARLDDYLGKKKARRH